MIRLVISILISISVATLNESVHAKDNLPCGTVNKTDGVAVIVTNKGGEQITLQASETSAQLPVGKYQIEEWTIEHTDEESNNWKLTGNNFGKKGVFYVIEDQEVKLLVGEPIVPYLYATKSDTTYYLNHNLKGQLSEIVTITKNGARPDAPKLQITNADVSYQEILTFHYG